MLLYTSLQGCSNFSLTFILYPYHIDTQHTILYTPINLNSKHNNHSNGFRQGSRQGREYMIYNGLCWL